jgi:hypothetical protein
MKHVLWNVRGFGRVDKRKVARKCKGEKPLIVCLQEKNYRSVMIFCAHLCGVVRLLVSHFVPRLGRRAVYLLSGTLHKWRCGHRLAVIMSCGVMVSLSRRARNLWWLMYTHLARKVLSKGCGTCCPRDCSR